MIIRLSKKMRISAEDGYNFTLQVRKFSTRKKAHWWKSIGYHSTLLQAAQKALNVAPAYENANQEVPLKKFCKLLENAAQRILLSCDGSFNAMQAAEFTGESGDSGEQEMYYAPPEN